MRKSLNQESIELGIQNISISNIYLEVESSQQNVEGGIQTENLEEKQSSVSRKIKNKRNSGVLYLPRFLKEQNWNFSTNSPPI